MFKDDVSEETAKISYSNADLSKVINMSEPTISRCNKSLQAKGYLTIEPNKDIDFETGLHTTTKIFNISKLEQLIIYAIRNQAENIKRINEENKIRDDKFRQMQEDIEELRKTVAKLIKRK